LGAVRSVDNADLFPERVIFGPAEDLSVHLEFAGDLGLTEAQREFLPPWGATCALLQTEHNEPHVDNDLVWPSLLAYKSDCGRLYPGEARPFRVVFRRIQGDGKIRSKCQDYLGCTKKDKYCWYKPSFEVSPECPWWISDQTPDGIPFHRLYLELYLYYVDQAGPHYTKPIAVEVRRRC
jgi:hypothetical protein